MTATEPCLPAWPRRGPMPEALLKVGDVARLLNVPESWVYAEASAGRLPSVKCGRYRRFFFAEIEGYLAERQRLEQEERERLR